MHNRHRLLHHSHYSCVCIYFPVTLHCILYPLHILYSCTCIQWLDTISTASISTVCLYLFPSINCTHCRPVSIPLVSFIYISVSIVLIQYPLSSPPVSVSTVLIGNLRGFVPQDWWRQLCLIGKFILLLFYQSLSPLLPGLKTLFLDRYYFHRCGSISVCVCESVGRLSQKVRNRF